MDRNGHHLLDVTLKIQGNIGVLAADAPTTVNDVLLVS